MLCPPFCGGSKTSGPSDHRNHRMLCPSFCGGSETSSSESSSDGWMLCPPFCWGSETHGQRGNGAHRCCVPRFSGDRKLGLLDPVPAHWAGIFNSDARPFRRADAETVLFPPVLLRFSQAKAAQDGEEGDAFSQKKRRPEDQAAQNDEPGDTARSAVLGPAVPGCLPFRGSARGGRFPDHGAAIASLRSR